MPRKSPSLTSLLKGTPAMKDLPVSQHGKDMVSSIQNLMEVEEARAVPPVEPPKTVWVRDSKGYLHELPSDTPAQVDRTMRMDELGKMPFDDIRIFLGNAWVRAMRIDPPKTVAITIYVQSDRDAKDVVDIVRKKLNHRDVGDRPDLHRVELRVLGDA